MGVQGRESKANNHVEGTSFRQVRPMSRGVRIFDSANSNFEKMEKVYLNSNSNWQIGIRFARIVVVQNRS
jgi:hypothetical protein